MRLLAPLLLLLIATAPDARAQECRADFDASGAVEINEVIQAVGEALNGCGQPTPTQSPTFDCPVLFTGDNRPDDSPVCVFTQETGPCEDTEFPFYTDGSFVIVYLTIGDGVTSYYGANVVSPTTATFFGRWTADDLSDFRSARGSATLGNRLRLTNVSPALSCENWLGRYDTKRFTARSHIRAMFAALHAR